MPAYIINNNGGGGGGEGYTYIYIHVYTDIVPASRCKGPEECVCRLAEVTVRQISGRGGQKKTRAPRVHVFAR